MSAHCAQESMRDGLEDHAYLALARSICSKAPKVPAELFSGIQPEPAPTTKSYSEDPGVLRKWRSALAAAIESGAC